MFCLKWKFQMLTFCLVLRHRSANRWSLALSCGCFWSWIFLRFAGNYFLFTREYLTFLTGGMFEWRGESFSQFLDVFDVNILSIVVMFYEPISSWKVEKTFFLNPAPATQQHIFTWICQILKGKLFTLSKPKIWCFFSWDASRKRRWKTRWFIVKHHNTRTCFDFRMPSRRCNAFHVLFVLVKLS